MNWYALSFLNRSLVLKETLLPLLPPLDQIKEGLKLYGLLDLMKAEQQLFKIVFVENNVLQWTFEKFEDFVEALCSEHGTSQKNIEINVFKAFLDAMESFFYKVRKFLLAFHEIIVTKMGCCHRLY